MPFVYTEQGISMLASVLHSDVAVRVSISIMRTFVELRRFYANNAALFERISSVELRQLEYQRQTNEKFDEVFAYIGEHTESGEKLFFDRQIYDAHSFLVSLIVCLHQPEKRTNQMRIEKSRDSGAVFQFLYIHRGRKDSNSIIDGEDIN